jgi:hypothetical protein
MAERVMGEGFARDLLRDVELVKNALREWRDEHPNVVHYQVEEAWQGLEAAERALEYLERGEHYPEWLTAMAQFRDSHRA